MPVSKNGDPPHQVSAKYVNKEHKMTMRAFLDVDKSHRLFPISRLLFESSLGVSSFSFYRNFDHDNSIS